MIADVFNASSYSFSAYSIPTFLTALGILALGVAVLVRERISPVSISFFALALSVNIWLFCFSWAYSAGSVEVANFWERASYLGVPFIAPATYSFTLIVLRKYQRFKRQVRLCWLAAACFSYLSLFTNSIIAGPVHFWWGYYIHYSLSGLFFIAFFCAVLVVSMGHYIIEYRSGRGGDLVRLRIRALMLAFAVGYIGVLDFAPVYGVPLYPFGYLPIAGFVVLSARAIWIYRLVDITPAFAAQKIIETMTDALVVFDSEGVIRLANEASEEIFGRPREEAVGRPAGNAFTDDFFGSQIVKLLGSGPVSNHEIAYRGEDSAARALSVSSSVMRDVHGRPSATVLIARDITQHKTFEAQLEYQALHDPLTDLPNRTLFVRTLAHALKRPFRRSGQLAVLRVNVDNFKMFNDSLGHSAGDRLIVSSGQRLLECMEPGRTVARLAADEFAVLLENVVSPEEAMQVAERIHQVFKAPILHLSTESALPDVGDEHDLAVNVSIGIALEADSRTDSAEEFLRSAGVAMQEAKSNGKAQSALYHPGLDSRARSRLQRETDLRRAFERSELAVYYQPLVRLDTGKLYGFEALLRWTHPQRGPISPVEFIPLAEETGLIVPIGQWVLEKACDQLKSWEARFPEERILVSVNLSVRQFRHPSLIDDISRVLAETRLRPSHLQLEITESIGLEDMASAQSTLWRLKDLGVHLALDDFGTGYSALGYLKRFPIDTIKLDRSFVIGLGQNAEDTAITHAVIAFAKALRLDVTAEGIETRDQLARLLSLGCDHGQGYLFARPATADHAGTLIEQLGAGAGHASLNKGTGSEGAPYGSAPGDLPAKRLGR